MDVKDAVRIAKAHIADLFREEGAINIGLEEVEHHTQDDSWRVTIGLSRPWDKTNPLLDALKPPFRRDYKVVTIDSSHTIVSVKNRTSEIA